MAHPSITATCSSKSLVPVTMRRLNAALGHMGYRLLDVEINADAGRVEVRRHDGYTLTLDVRHSVSTITREMLQHDVVAVGRRGERFLAERLSMRFLGRTRVVGETRTALHAFAETISENAATAPCMNGTLGPGCCGAALEIAEFLSKPDARVMKGLEKAALKFKGLGPQNIEAGSISSTPPSVRAGEQE